MSDIDIYVERYCKKHNCTKEEAETHKLVQEVKKYYKENTKRVVI